MGRNNAKKTHSPRFLVDCDLSGLCRIHIERRGVVTVSRLRIDVFTKLVRVGPVPANDSIRSQLPPNHLPYGQRMLRIVIQKDLTVRKPQLLLRRFENSTCNLRELLASVNSRMPNGVAHVKRAPARSSGRVKGNHVCVERVHACVFDRDSKFLGCHLRKHRAAALTDFHRARKYGHLALTVNQNRCIRSCGRSRRLRDTCKSFPDLESFRI